MRIQLCYVHIICKYACITASRQRRLLVQAAVQTTERFAVVQTIPYGLRRSTVQTGSRSWPTPWFGAYHGLTRTPRGD